jgi:hypothetical protein
MLDIYRWFQGQQIAVPLLLPGLAHPSLWFLQTVSLVCITKVLNNLDTHSPLDGAYPTPAPTETTFGGGYGNLHTDCGESMIFALGSAIGRQVLLPAWSESKYCALNLFHPLTGGCSQGILMAVSPATIGNSVNLQRCSVPHGHTPFV